VRLHRAALRRAARDRGPLRRRQRPLLPPLSAWYHEQAQRRAYQAHGAEV